MANQRELIKEGGLTVVGRYMNGNEVIGYHLAGNSAEGGKVTKEQLLSLIKKGAITNCTAQMYKGEVLFRGKDGFKLSELPVFDEKTGQYKNTSAVIKGKKADGSLGKYSLVTRLMLGNELFACVITDGSGTERCISKSQLMKLVSDGNILNVKSQMNNGKVLLRYTDKEGIKTESLLLNPYFSSVMNSPVGREILKGMTPESFKNLVKSDEYLAKTSGGADGNQAGDRDCLDVVYKLYRGGMAVGKKNSSGNSGIALGISLITAMLAVEDSDSVLTSLELFGKTLTEAVNRAKSIRSNG